MALQPINVGTTGNDGTGDAARTAFQKVNANEAYLLSLINAIDAGNAKFIETNFGAGAITITAGANTTGPEIAQHINTVGFTINLGELIVFSLLVKRTIGGTVYWVRQKYLFKRNNLAGTWGTTDPETPGQTHRGTIVYTDLILTYETIQVEPPAEETAVYINLGDIGVTSIEGAVNFWVGAFEAFPALTANQLADDGSIYYFACRQSNEDRIYRYVGAVPVTIGSGGDTTIFSDYDLVSSSNPDLPGPQVQSGILESIYCVKSGFNAKGDAVNLQDGNIQSGTNTFNSNLATFNASDIGKVIAIKGAGANSGWLVTTITTIIDNNNVELNLLASTTVSNSDFLYGTDDTSAIQSAINECYNKNGGIVYIPTGIYILNGPLINDLNINQNSQLYIPESNQNRTSKPTVSIIGATPPNFRQSGGIGSAIPDTANTLLVSTIIGSGTRPSVIANKGNVNNLFQMSFTGAYFENLSIQYLLDLNNRCTIGGINCIESKTANFKNIVIMPFRTNLADAEQPQSDIIGIGFPKLNSEHQNLAFNCLVGGLDQGYRLGEHSIIINSTAWACKSGVMFTSNSHLNVLTKIITHTCIYDIDFEDSSFSYFEINGLQSEVLNNGSWYDSLGVINDPSNVGVGRISVNMVKSGVGQDNEEFKKVGGENIIVSFSGVKNILNLQNSNYTLKITDKNKIINAESSSGLVITVPSDSNVNFDIGETIPVIQGLNGLVSFEGQGGVTILTPFNARTNKQYSQALLKKISTNVWVLTGDLDNSPILLSAIISNSNPNDIVLTFDRVVEGTNLGFSINGTSSTNFNSLSGSGTNVITGTMSNAAQSGENITLTYSESTGDLKDLQNVKLRDITNYAVSNNVNVSYLFDTYNNGLAGYSLRKLRSLQNNCIRIERDSDNAQTDVLLEQNGLINLNSQVSAGGTLLNWVGANNAYIVTWYDQSGNGNDVNITIADAPRIINAGALETKDALAAINFIATNKRLERAAIPELNDGNNASFFIVSSSNNVARLSTIITTSDTTSQLSILHDPRSVKRCAWVQVSGTYSFADLDVQYSNTNRWQLSVIVKGTTKQLSVWKDGVAGSQDVNWSGSYANNKFSVGVNNVNSYMIGYIQEVVLFSDDKTADRIDIEQNQNVAFNL